MPISNAPSDGGHPGQAYHCRCFAEPISVTVSSDANLVDYVPNEGCYPIQDLAEHQDKGGHTISLHVGKSEEFLFRAVSVDQFQSWFFSTFRKRHGSFSSLQAAQRLTNSNLSQNAQIANDLATGRRTEAFIISAFASVTGV